MKSDFNISDLLEDSNKETDSLIQLEEYEETFISSNFSDKKNFVSSLFKAQPSHSYVSYPQKLDIPSENQKEERTFGSDSVILKGWKNVENIPARLIETFEDVVVLECLIDKESELYEEREFRASLFTGYELNIGNLFYLRFFDRDNETRMEIHNDSRLTSINDFPKKDFSTLFANSKLFKK